MNNFPWLKIPCMIALWIGMLVTKFVVFVAGLFVMPFMWKYSATDYDDLPACTRLWSNIEDWQGQPHHWGNSLPKWWVDEKVKKVYARVWDRPLNLIKSVIWLVPSLFKLSRPHWLIGQDYISIESRGATFWSFYVYHAIRNSANGLRAIKPFQLSIDVNEVEYVSSWKNHYKVGDDSTPAVAEHERSFTPEYLRAVNRKFAAYFAWQDWKAAMSLPSLAGSRQQYQN